MFNFTSKFQDTKFFVYIYWYARAVPAVLYIQIRSDPKLMNGSGSEYEKINSDPDPGSTGSEMNLK
jgi:hypothetical protein